jgi:hypothetical protein
MASSTTKHLVTFDQTDEGIQPFCAHCRVHTRSIYSCEETAETAARLLGWAPSKIGFACSDCLEEAKKP